MIPGGNIFRLAMSVIGGVSDAKLFKFQGEDAADDGTRISKYADPVDLCCTSIQPIDRSRYQSLGLSFEKTYYSIFTECDISGVDRAYDGDVVEWDSMRLQVVSDNPWKSIDGWNEATLVVIGRATGATSQPCEA